MSINHLVNPNIKPRLDLYVNSVTSLTPIGGNSSNNYWVTNPDAYGSTVNLHFVKKNILEITEYKQESLVRIRGSGLIDTVNLPNGSLCFFEIDTNILGYPCLGTEYIYADIQNKNTVNQGGKNILGKLVHKSTTLQPIQAGINFRFELPVVDTPSGFYNDQSAVFSFDIIINTIF